MVIIECTKDFVEAIAKLNLSPPLRFGRVKANEKEIDRVFVGICTDREMQMHLMKVEALIESGGSPVERRIRGLS